MYITIIFVHAEGGAPNFGWTFYAPLSTTYAPTKVTFFIFSVHIMGASSIMGSINVIVTIMNMRAPGMTLMKMPLFVWSWLITAYLLIAVMPVLAGAVTMMLMDIHFGTSFFNAAGGGDPVLFQHIFWFFGHPEVYIMILASLWNHVSHHIETFSRKPTIWAYIYGLGNDIHCDLIFCCMGSSHVYCGSAARSRTILYVGNDVDCSPNRCKSI